MSSYRILTSPPVWFTLLLLVVFTFATQQMLASAPQGLGVDRIEVTPGEKPIILGHDELGQHSGGGRGAATDHIRVRRDAKGAWWIANVSAQRKVDAQTEDGTSRYLKRWKLLTGDRLRLGSPAIDVEVTESSPAEGRLILRGAGVTARWEGWHLDAVGPKPISDCPQEGPNWWRRLLPKAEELPLFSIGGQVRCDHRWYLPGIEMHGVYVRWHHGDFWLAPGKSEVRLARAGEGHWRGFSDLELRLDDPANPTKKLILGRTHYQLSWKDSTLILNPKGGTDIWQPDDKDLPKPRDPRVHLQWKPTGVLSGAEGLIWRLLPLGLGLIWGAASLLLIGSGRLKGATGWLWVATLGLVGCGVLTQGQLGLGGNNTRWLIYAEHHWWGLAIMGLVTLIVLLLKNAFLEHMAARLADPSADPLPWRKIQSRVPWLPQVPLLLTLITVPAILLLIAQFATGREEGLAGFQPVEGVKSLIALLLAYAGGRLWARRIGLGSYHRSRPLISTLQLLGFALIFVFLAAFMLWAVQDMSPVVLLLLLLLPFAWRIAPHPLGVPSRGGWWVRIAVALALLGGIAFLTWAHKYPDQVPRWMPQYLRFMVWADPQRFVESGYQVNQALSLGASQSVESSPTIFGWNGAVMNLPEVQNDFIGTFLLNHFGVYFGWGVLLCQLTFALSLFTLSRNLADWGAKGDASRRHAGDMLSLTIFAFAWLFLAHWLIAWGNVLGLLPVMGQPMTFIAAGNSHLLLFALPGLVLGLTGGRLAEKESIGAERK